MIYSKTCEYALRALGHLASKERGSLTMIPEVSRKTGVPAPYIAKIFQTLVRGGILESQRGPCGGFAFRKSPETISLFEVVQVIDNVSPLVNQCVMGLNECSSANACPLHLIWSRAKENILQCLKTTTLNQMRKKVGRLRYRKLMRSRLQAVTAS
ncbi:MAG: Rrf2 family transcriptional regulator [Candidatus Omnitrophica bacterium]|nr:Rrf2 family transcriptional regulator [Candidatus Omnitrophota bacterium]